MSNTYIYYNCNERVKPAQHAWYLTFRAVLPDEAFITNTHSVLTASLVLAVIWAGQQ